MEPLLIALDLDGTLLTSEKVIGKKTKETLAKLRAAGHIVIFSTGRPYRACQAYYEELGLDTPIVNFNGAYVHHPLDPEWGVFHTPIEQDTLTAIMETCAAFHPQNIIVEVMDDVYIKNPDPELVESFRLGARKMIFGEIHENVKNNPSCVLLQTDDKDTDRLLAALDSAHADAIEQRSWGQPSNIIEIVRRGVNKSVGLKRVADYFHIPRERIIAFGDEDNDIEMLKFAGRGVAMGNALDEIKEIADAVTASNDEDGIALYLEENVLKPSLNSK